MKLCFFIGFYLLYNNIVWCQKRDIINSSFKSCLTREYLGLDSNNKVVNSATLEDKELPISFRKIILNQHSLVLKFISCGLTTPECWPIKDLIIFGAKKNKHGILFDTITLFREPLLNVDSFFLAIPSSRFYQVNTNKTESVKININKFDFIYFYSREYWLTELDLRCLRNKIKKFRRK